MGIAVADLNSLQVRSLGYDILAKILVEYTNCAKIWGVLGGFKILGPGLEKAGQYDLWGSCYTTLHAEKELSKLPSKNNESKMHQLCPLGR